MKNQNAFVKKFVCLILLLLVASIFGQTSDNLINRANQLLDNYSPPEPVVIEPQLAPGESWLEHYFETINKNNIQSMDSVNVFRVNTMPSYYTSSQYANAIAGQPISIWGNVHNGTPPYTYKLEYGDGSSDSGAVADPHYIGHDHTYPNAGTRTMILTVWDNAGKKDIDQSVVRVFAVPTDQININMAIEKGLLYLYKNQYADGHWYDGYSNTAATGASLLSFEENGHLPTNDYDSDIYAEYVRLGMDYLLNHVSTYSISMQPHGNPDSDADGTGAYLNYRTYANGIGLLAILGAYRSASEAMSDIINVGFYNGQSHYDFMVDAIDQIAFAQTDSVSGTDRGGWRYNINTPNYGSSDNSIVQWPGLVIEAAENNWGMAIHPFVKDELFRFLQASQDTSGGFGYDTHSYAYWRNIAKTGAGIGSYSSFGYTTANPLISKAITFIDNRWSETNDNRGYGEHLNGNIYAMYALAKGMRIINNRLGESNIGTHNWYQIYSDHLLNHANWGQNSDGSWNNSVWFSNYPALSSAFAILVLTQGVVIPPPVAVISKMSGFPTNSEFQLNGSDSFHQNPEKSILQWLWDFNGSDGLDWENPDATGPVPMNPGYAVEGNYQITLRVKDNSESPLFDTDNIFIEISDTSNHSPIAVPIPPGSPSYAGRVSEPIFLDGSFSYDPDFPADSVVSYNWDTNGDGKFGDSRSDTVTVFFQSEYQGQVGLRVYDTQGDSSSNIAYITIVASRKDIIVTNFNLGSSSVAENRLYKQQYTTPIIPGDTLDIVAAFKNSNESNTDVSQALVRFYDEDPLTIGNRLGGDYFVDLPVSGTDTIKTSVQLPEDTRLGPRKVYVYLDPSDQVSEWDEKNNLRTYEINVVLIPAPNNLNAYYTQGTVELSWEDKADNELGFVVERKFKSDTTFSVLDSIEANNTSYVDSSPQDSMTYVYRVYAFNDMGISDMSNEFELTVIFAGIHDQNQVPDEFNLAQNYPNPFNPKTRISYQLPVLSEVNLSIYNLLGQKVTSLIETKQSTGYYNVEWDASNLASGVYIYILQANPNAEGMKPFTQVRKMILLK